MNRIFADAVLLGLAFLSPWWVTFLAATALFFVFPNFYELIAAGMLLDLLYGAPVPRLFGFQFALSLFALLLFILLGAVKRRMRV